MTNVLNSRRFAKNDSNVWLDTALDVVRAFTERKVLKKYNGDLKIFLTENMHYFYHQKQMISKKCCECKYDSSTISRGSRISIEVFTQLYCSSEREIEEHIVDEKGHLVQECLHQFKANEVQLDQLDIRTICSLLSHKGDLSQNEETAVQKIQLLVEKMYGNVRVDIKELGNALEKLVYPEYYRKVITRLLNELQKDDEAVTDFKHQLFKDFFEAEQTKSLEELFTINEEKESLVKLDEPTKEISIGNLKFQLHDNIHEERNQGIIQTRIEQLQTSSGSKIHTVIWKLDMPKEWNLDKIKSNLATTETYANNRVRIKAIKRGSLIIESTVEDHVLRDQWNETPKLFLQEVVKIGKIDTNEECTIAVTANIFDPEPEIGSLHERFILSMGGDQEDAISSIFLLDQRSERPYPKYLVCDGIFVDCTVSKELEYGKSEVVKLAKVIDKIKSIGAFRKLLSLQKGVLHNKIMTEDSIIHMLQIVIQLDGGELSFRYILGYVIVAEVHKGKMMLSRIDSFHGIEIIYKEVNGQSKEALCIVEHVDGLQVANTPLRTIKGVSSEDAKKYFAKYSKLSMISKSPFKSKGFGHNYQTFESVHCIQLFCRAKGLLPIGESHFPEQINSIQTDILEGYPKLIARSGIRIGSQILIPKVQVNTQANINTEETILPDTGAGTAGGFLRYHGEDAFLTCAHVICDWESLIHDKSGIDIHDNPVKIFCPSVDSPGNMLPCGKLAGLAFPPDQAMGSSVDAAIVKIDQALAHICIDANNENEMKSKYLHHCCLDWRELGVHSKNIEVHAAGSVSSIQKADYEVKIIDGIGGGKETLVEACDNEYRDINRDNITDDLHFIAQAVRNVSARMSANPTNVQFLSQIEMPKIKCIPGDSGMCIYVRNPADKKFWCIEMAIASAPSGGCIITPLKAILKQFNYNLKC